MLEKIKGARLDPKASREIIEKLTENINNLEVHHNCTVDEIRNLQKEINVIKDALRVGGIL